MRASLRKALRGLNKFVPSWPTNVGLVPAVALCIYRSKNARHVRKMIGQLSSDVEIRLHALDDVVPDLAPYTRSAGPGERTELLQRLVDQGEIPQGYWVILFDDDCNFARSGGTQFLEIAAKARLDIAGAAIDVNQPHSFNHTVVRPFSMARLVNLVEIGPVVALSPRAQEEILPFPPDSGMGWGLDVLWSTYSLRRGYVDAAPIEHHGAVAVNYAAGPERERTATYLKQAGVSSVYALVGTLEHWRKWRRQPPWRSRRETGS